VSQNVNLRSGPDISFASLAKLKIGDAVDISKCQGSFCYVTSSVGKGWVSAAYLTRDSVKPPVAATSAPETPRIASAPAVIAPAPATPRIAGAPAAVASRPARIASIAPAGPAPSAAPPVFPPAYDTTVPRAAASAAVPAKAPAVATPAPPPVAAAENEVTTLPMPSASGHDDLTTADIPRPKADIPDVPDPATADSGDFGSDGVAPQDDGAAASAADDDRLADGIGPTRFHSFDRWHRRFAGLDADEIGPARACFVDADGGRGFCVREGEQLSREPQWADRAFYLRNPAGLEVTVCTDAPYRDCHVFVRSGPLAFDHERSIASVSVAPAGY
jgi:hypothetical protein